MCVCLNLKFDCTLLHNNVQINSMAAPRDTAIVSQATNSKDDETLINARLA